MITLDNVAFRYGDRPLFGGVSLDVQPGDFYFLTGPSGAGKTTLVRLCYLDLAPEDGTVTCFGKPGTTLARDEIADMRQRIGVVHQDCRFLDHLSVADNIALPVSVAGRAVSEGDLSELLKWVGLSGRADARPPELSGGERQRAALARAVMMDPDVILADEPTGNIDWEMSQRLLTLLVELNRMGKAILLATHDMALIRQAKTMTTARVLRLAGGTLQQAGTDL
ncbi:ABC transporter related [Dinoroseobacter shibae DFL 12 = DSM 16493]|jgi:cell division transport system ATP-binding protein|uniref:ABC transporter related n=1 Tax=Dinoroseobacter shibae (strain DSM 16493 / NCIMB 14021 / DFL 12) TaxID=398580 RepID=A8LL40_DINSH|nr:ATP-binding cassette domain-containing protein [Dinoroseobacter shibae]ABV94789.1 ABC transporter related [Dinoroseobacter shibae DFL 12 = DSM 16493]URF46208.1 ATP-binding cassette domain-containing protein [Dinoroseobacter shibae]URF50515.1 ATP-binding cassette domain-containing protein [Dinoroseobacter shibae]